VSKSVLMVFSARLDDAARAAVAAGRWPRKDFFALADVLGGEVIDDATLDGRRAWRLLRRLVGAPSAKAWLAFRRSHRCAAIFTDGEHIGLPLALLLRLSRRPPRHVTIGHLLSTPSKRAVFRRLRPQGRLDLVLVHAAEQARVAVEELGLRPEQVRLVPYQVDPAFWAPDGRPPEDLVCSAGLEYRDYATLLAAVAGLPVRVVIAAASYWSRHRRPAGDVALPANVTVTALDYVALRELYARSRFVVVPLRPVDNQAGITTVLEAMAMGKAVVVTATRGQRDVVRGRLCTAAGPMGEPLGGPAAFGCTGPDAEAETGLYVPPGDPAALRAAICYLLDHADEAVRMGAAGRRVVEQWMSLDHFVARVVAAVRGREPEADLGRAGAARAASVL
jgi:glycosyltransferase involved in cell wall biosynthesis